MPHSPATGLTPSRDRAAWLRRLAWLPAVVYLAFASAALFASPAVAFEPPGLLPLLNLVFRLGVGLAFAAIAAGAYLETGALSMLALGTGMLTMGIGSTLAAHLVTLRGPQASVPMHTLATLLAGACLFLAGALTLFAATLRAEGRRQRRRLLLAAYTGTLVLQGLILLVVLTQKLPPFFLPGHGQTALGRALLAAAAATFVLAALCFGRAYLVTRLRFFQWYAVGLVLFAVGLAVLLQQVRMSNLVTWAGRWGQFLGGAYLLAALLHATPRRHPNRGRFFGTSLLQSTLPYRPLVESVSEAVIALDMQGKILYWNEAATRLFGYSAAEAFGRDLVSLVVPDSGAAAVQAAVRTGRGATLELELRSAPAQTFPAELSFYIDPGHPGLTVCTIRDLTERKRTEALLRRTNEDLERQVAVRTAEAEQRARDAELERRRLAAVLDALPAGVAIADATGKIVRSNAALTRIWGQPPVPASAADYREWRGRWADTGRPLAADDWAMARALRTGEVAPGDVVEIEKFDGSGTAIILNAAAPIRDASGEIVGGVVAEVDITAQQRAEEALRRALAEREAALAANEALLREVHHRVKNNLQMVCSLLELQGEAIGSPEGKEALEVSAQRIYAIARLYEQLYRAMASGQVNLGEYLRGLAENFRDSAGVEGISFTFPGRNGIFVDAERAIPCGLILNELLTNAVKHAFAPGAPGRVGIELQQRGEMLHLRVWDNGRGLPAGLQLQGSNSLGLRLVRILAQRLRAEIRVESYEGAAFTLTFPAMAE